MRAAVCRSYGPPEDVVVAEIPVPELGPGQARVRVHAASVNFPDVLMAAGEYQVKVDPPFVLGSEFAGEVIEVADDVADLLVGQYVFGSTIVGGFAEEAVMRSRSLRPVPPGVSNDVAAAFGVAHFTAYHVLRSVARLQPGEQVIVLGAGSGVGLAAVQLATLLGGKVTAVASSDDKLAAAAAAGATGLVNHGSRDLRQALRELLPDGADVVIDPVGGDLAEPSLRSLHWNGRFVTVGYASGAIPRIPLNLVLLKGIHVLGFQFGLFAQHEPEEMRRNEEELIDLLATGKTIPYISAVYPLDDVVAALRLVADGQAVGKLVIDILWKAKSG